jgi:pimeloyl-ACP methyl ester carboxylesterase
MAKWTGNGVELYYESHGDGPPLLLIAGLASDSQSWLPVLRGLSSRRRVITFDNRGAGRTQPPDAPISISAMADDAVGLIAHLGLDSVDLLGHSMGGFVAQDLASRYPRQVGRLILAGTSIRNCRRNNVLLQDWAAGLEAGIDPESWFRNFFYWIFSARFYEDEAAVSEAVRAAVAYPYPQSPAAFRGQVRALSQFDGAAGSARIAARTLVLGGQEDLLFPARACAELAEKIPGASLSFIDHAAHAMHWENPRAFTEAVLGFLDSR